MQTFLNTLPTWQSIVLAVLLLLCWCFVGFVVTRNTDTGEIIAMLHGDRAYLVAYCTLVFAVLCWPIAWIALVLFCFVYDIISDLLRGGWRN